MERPDGEEGILTRSHRVQRTGRSSLAVTLPKSWTTALNIHMGDPVVFHQRGDGALELTFSATKEREESTPHEVSIDASGATPDIICRLLVGAYISGQDHIVVTNLSTDCRKQMPDIDRVVKHLVGTSLISDSSDRLEFEVFVDPSKYRHSALHNRLSQMLHMEVETLRQALYRGDPHLLAPLPGIEDEIDRFYYLITRQVHLASNDYRLARSSGMPSHNLQLGCRLIAKMLEVVGDLLQRVGHDLEGVLSAPEPLPDEVREELSQILGRFDVLVRSTMENVSNLRAPDANETLEELGAATREIEALRDRLVRPPRDRETHLLVHIVAFRLLMGLELLQVVNETVINRVMAPENVAANGFRPVTAGAVLHA